MPSPPLKLGVKSVNSYGSNTPLPFNKLFINPNFQFRLQCIILTVVVALVRFVNRYIIATWNRFMNWLGSFKVPAGFRFGFAFRFSIPGWFFGGASWTIMDWRYITIGNDSAGCTDFLAIGAGLQIGFALCFNRPFQCWAQNKLMPCYVLDSFCTPDNPNKFFAPGCTVPKCNTGWLPIKCSGERSEEGDKDCEGKGSAAVPITSRNSRGVEETELYCAKINMANEYGVVNYDFQKIG